MTEQYVTKSSLSCLFNEDSSVEIIPEPFRLQPEVIFHIAYSEYVAYIKALDVQAPIILSRDIGILKSLAQVNHESLYKAYLADMAFALCKELSFAEKFKRQCTLYLPSSEDGKESSLVGCLESYRYVHQLEGELLSKVTGAGFKLPRTINPINRYILELAVILYSASKLQVVLEEFNFVYDRIG